MKPIKNDRTSYKTRSSVGGVSSLVDARKIDNHKRTNFNVDPAGYFTWPKLGKRANATKPR